jgi:Protein of unknown function (DUF3102)
MPAFLPAPVSSSFDYSILAPESAQFVRQRTDEIQSLMNETINLVERTLHNRAKIGKRLIEIKEELEHGQWLNWIEAFFPWGERTAQDFVKIASNPQYEIIADLEVAPTVGIILSSLKTPQQAGQVTLEAAELVKKGEKLTVKKAKELRDKHLSQQKTPRKEKKTIKAKPLASTVEIIDAELESPPSHSSRVQPASSTPSTSTVSFLDEVQQPPEVKALRPSPPSLWWRLSGKEQKHLLFNGHPDDSEFLASLPDEVGLWMSFPPIPEKWQTLPKDKKIKTALSYATTFHDINLKVIRHTLEGLLSEITFEGNNTALLAYLSDAPFLALLDDFGFDCYIAEPDVEQCQKILSVWQQLGGEMEKLDSLESGAVV